MAFEDAMIKHQIDPVMCVIESDALLSFFKAESFAHFKQEALELTDDLSFKV